MNDREAIRKELEKDNLTAEERTFLHRLLAKKQEKTSMEECLAVEAEGEVWLHRKDKRFELDDDVLTD